MTNRAIPAAVATARNTSTHNVMLGHVPDERQEKIVKMVALLNYIAPRVPTSTHLRIVAAFADFKAFQHLGEPMVGLGWRKGAEFAYPDGMTERSWERLTQRIFRRHRALPLLLAGDLIAAYALLKAVRQ